MAYIKYVGDYYYIVEKKGKKKIIYLKNLGKILKVEAEIHLAEWKRQMKIKPVYRCLVIDPPWPMEKIKRDLFPNQVEMDYKTMSIEEIKEFPLRKFMHPDGCHVYLWTTQRFLFDAKDVLESWGVNYHCLMTWIKGNGFTPFFPGFMYTTEFVLFGTVGNIPVMRKGLPLHFEGGRREHSRKPDVFYSLVERASPGPRIDIFSREKRGEFDQYGFEINRFEGDE